jgi:hypothetical protein
MAQNLYTLSDNEIKNNTYYDCKGFAYKLVKCGEEEMKHHLTKREAELKLYQAKVPRDMSGEYNILNVLEALGLIEFAAEHEPVKKEQYLSLKILNWSKEYGEVHIYDTPEGLEVWIGGQFRYRQKR